MATLFLLRLVFIKHMLAFLIFWLTSAQLTPTPPLPPLSSAVFAIVPAKLVGGFFFYMHNTYIFPLTLFCLWIIFAFPCCHVFVSEFIENLQTSNNWLQPEIIKSAIGTCAQLRARWQQYNNMLREGESEVRESTAAQLRGSAKWNSVYTLHK